MTDTITNSADADSQNAKQIRYGRGQNPNSLLALKTHGNHGGRRKASVTDALGRVGSDDELAELIVSCARKGDSSAMRLWAQYRQSPESVQRVVESEDAADGAIGYGGLSDADIDAAIAEAESIIRETATVESRAGAPPTN